MLNNCFLGVFRGQAPGITLLLPMDTRIDAPSDQCPRNITQSTSIS
jgi:allophanate hydrolase subunit 1